MNGWYVPLGAKAPAISNGNFERDPVEKVLLVGRL